MPFNDASQSNAVYQRATATSAREDIEALARQLADEHGCALAIDEDGPLPYGVWALGGAAGDDLIGAGESMTEALSDAIATMRGWQ